ncbi:MAG TPA: hypothetical protein VNB87_05330 [Propionibacteriaceae bacterium]|nr:hypothetical protein [Propionibacteriaceae bacterium]
MEPDGDQGDLSRGAVDHRSPTDRAVLLRPFRSSGLPASCAGLASAPERVGGLFLRIYGAGDYRWKGADLGVLVTQGRLQRRTEGEADTLTIRAKHLIDSIRQQYAGLPLAGGEANTAPLATAPSMAK